MLQHSDVKNRSKETDRQATKQTDKREFKGVRIILVFECVIARERAYCPSLQL